MLKGASLCVSLAAIIYLSNWISGRGSEQSNENVETRAGEPHPGNYYQEGAERTVAALINAIHAEGRANRKEEKREDRGKKFIDGITLVVLICTLVALVLTYFAIRKQVDEMKRVYDPIEK